jgi:menaquinone-dependent protoporphyrinogen IX oxidase
MNGLIIYKSKYGSTREYAKWISEATGYVMKSTAEVTKSDILLAEKIVIGSPVMAGKYTISGWLKKHWEILKDKVSAFYSVCATNLTEEAQIQSFWESSFPEDIRNNMKFFMFGGRKELNRLGSTMKFMLKTASKMEKDLKKREEILRDVNNMSPHLIDPLVDYVLKD